MLLMFVELIGGNNRVHPIVARLYLSKTLRINLLSIFVVVAGVPSQYPNVHLSVVPILRTIMRNMFNAPCIKSLLASKIL